MKKFLVLILATLSVGASAYDYGRDYDYGYGDRYDRGRCEFVLKNGRGRTLEYFVGRGYDRREACMRARRKCTRAIDGGYHRARRLYCEKVTHGGGYGRPIVQRSCTASLVGPRGWTQRTFLGRASGPRGTGVKGQACQRAMRQCHTFKRNNGRYRAHCRVEGRRGGLGLDIGIGL